MDENEGSNIKNENSNRNAMELDNEGDIAGKSNHDSHQASINKQSSLSDLLDQNKELL